MSGSVQRETLAVSLFLAAAAVIVASALGLQGVGAAVAVGLVVGSLNGFVTKLLLERRAPILPTSVLRLAMFSLVALAAAKLTGWPVWPLAAGLALAQVVMAGVGVRQGLRA